MDDIFIYGEACYKKGETTRRDERGLGLRNAGARRFGALSATGVAAVAATKRWRAAAAAFLLLIPVSSLHSSSCSLAPKDGRNVKRTYELRVTRVAQPHKTKKLNINRGRYIFAKCVVSQTALVHFHRYHLHKPTLVYTSIQKLYLFVGSACAAAEKQGNISSCFRNCLINQPFLLNSPATPRSVSQFALHYSASVSENSVSVKKYDRTSGKQLIKTTL